MIPIPVQSSVSSCSGLKPIAASFSRDVGALVLGGDGVEGSSAFFAGVSADELAGSVDGFELGVMVNNLISRFTTVRLLSANGEQNGATSARAVHRGQANRGKPGQSCPGGLALSGRKENGWQPRAKCLL